MSPWGNWEGQIATFDVRQRYTSWEGSRLGFSQQFETSYLLLNPDLTSLSCGPNSCSFLPHGVLSLKEANPSASSWHYYAKIYGGNYLINFVKGFYQIIPRRRNNKSTNQKSAHYLLNANSELPIDAGFHSFGGNQNMIFGGIQELLISEN